MLSHLLIACLLLYTEAHPGNVRMKRDEEIGGVTYAPCKDTYAQCPEWKRNGMCEMPQYKDYMPLVCTDTCGFCKEVKQQEAAAASKDQINQQPAQPERNTILPQPDQTPSPIQPYQSTNPTQPNQFQTPPQAVVAANSEVSTTAAPETTTPKPYPKEEIANMSETDKVMQAYTDSLKKYYEDLELRNRAYQESISNYLSGQTPQYTPPSLLTGIPDNNTTVAITNNISSPDNRELSRSLESPAKPAEPPSSDTPPNNLAPDGISAAYSPNYTPQQPYQPYPAQPIQPATPEPGSSSSSSSSSGTKSSSSSSTSSSSGTSVSVGVGGRVSTGNSSNQTEAANNQSNVTTTDASSLPSKVAPETPALPALPPLLVLPQISETLLIDETTPKVQNSSLEKDTEDKQKAALQQAADALPYAPEREGSSKNDAKVRVKSPLKLEKDRKITTEDQQTNEMTKTESKHLASLVHNLEDEGSDEEDDQKMIKTFSNQPGKLHVNKVYVKNKNLDADIKDAKKSTKETAKPSENEDDVFKHDEKSGSVSGSGAGAAEENFEDLNYITDFNPDDFDMDVPDLAHKDFMNIKNKRNTVELPSDHPLFSRYAGIQKRKSEITAPTIIDATEDGDNNNAVISFTDISDHPRSKIHAGARLKAVPKAEIKEVPKEEAGSGESESESDEESESESEEGSAKPADRKTNIKDKHNAGNYQKDKKNVKPVVADKKDKIEEKKTAKKSIKEKSKVTSAKSKVTANKKSKVTSLVKKASDKDKKDPKHVSKEKSEVSEMMSEKGDTAAVRNKKVEKKSSTGVVKKPIEGILSSRKDIPRNKEEPLSASVVITYSKRGKSSKKPAEKKIMKSIGTEATIADLSGAGSGEMDTDMLSGDGSYRSLVESGDDNDEGEEDEQDFSEARHMTGHHSSDPEKIHITPQANVQKQPDLNDFPAGRHKESAKHKESKGSFKEETQSTVTEAEAEARTDNSTGAEEGGEEATTETADAAQEEAPVAADAAAEADGETAEAATETADALPEATETAEAGTETAEATPEAGGVEENEQDGGEINDVKIEELLSPNEDRKEKKLNKEKDKSLNEGKISMVLSQNFNEHYGRKESPSYQMLAGNIKKDIEKMIKGAAVKDLAFSEVSVEGNPRQSGKTKVSFNVDASNNEWMKKLLKLVDGGDIDGLRVIKGSLEIEEEKKKK